MTRRGQRLFVLAALLCLVLEIALFAAIMAAAAQRIEGKIDARPAQVKIDPEAAWILAKLRQLQTCGTTAKTGKEKSNGKE